MVSLKELHYNYHCQCLTGQQQQEYMSASLHPNTYIAVCEHCSNTKKQKYKVTQTTVSVKVFVNSFE